MPEVRQQRSRYVSLVEWLGLAAVLTIAGAALLQAPLSSSRARSVPGSAARAPAAPDRSGSGACVMDAPGYLRGRIYGAAAIAIDWSGAGFTCEGMLRPGNDGLRLFFASHPSPDADGRLLLILGIDGPFEGLTGQERAANVTVIDETEDRFFSSRGSGRCWTQVRSVVRLPPTTVRSNARDYRLSGQLYCAGSLPSLRDRSSLTLGDIEYSGRVRVDGP